MAAYDPLITAFVFDLVVGVIAIGFVVVFHLVAIRGMR